MYAVKKTRRKNTQTYSLNDYEKSETKDTEATSFLFQLQVLTPLLLLLLAGTMILYDQKATVVKRKELSLSLYDYGRFLIFDPNGMVLLRYKLLNALSDYENIEVIWINSSDFCTHWPHDWPYVVGAVALGHDIKFSTFNETECSLFLEPFQSGDENATSKSWKNFNDDIFETVDCDADKMWIVPDIATYGFPTLTHFITQFYLGNDEQRIVIEMDLHDSKPLLQEITVFTIILSHVVVSSFFVTGPLQERLSFFKQQQLQSGLPILVYWITCFVYDLVATLPVAFLFFITLTIFSSKPRSLIVFLTWTYAVARLPMMYFASVFFRNTMQTFFILITFTMSYPYLMKMLLNSKLRSGTSDMSFLDGAQAGECIALFGERRETSSFIMEITRKDVTFCPRNDSLHPLLSLKSNLKIIAGLAGQSTETVEKMISLAALEDENQQESAFSRCSQMERRRACVTAAALTRLPILLLEAPFDMVDLKTRLYTWNVMREAQRSGRTVIFTTNSTEECEVICDRIGFVWKGRILAFRTIAELKQKFAKFVVLEVRPATTFDKEEVVNSISSIFPEATPLSVSPPCSQLLRWKLELPSEKDFLVKFDLLNELLLSLPVKESCVMKAPLDVIAQTVIAEHKEREGGE
ncbi:hypothetical protein Aduo_006374 [Ancylostoma duodenale]